MVFPILMNLVNIEISQLKILETFVDDDFREPISRKIRGSTILVKGQVNFGSKSFEERSITRTGDMEPTDGHLVFRKIDLDGLGVTIRKGDRVTKIAGLPTTLIVREVRPESPLNGAFLLLYVVLEHDREARESIV